MNCFISVKISKLVKSSGLALSVCVSLVRTADRCDAAEDEDGRDEEPLDQEESEGEHHRRLLTEIRRAVVSVGPGGIVGEHHHGALPERKRER